MSLANVLKLAIPNKGRLSDDSVALLARAGIHFSGSSDRRLFATALDGRIRVLFLRAADIPSFVADGTVDAGITGFDVIAESGLEVHERLDLGFGYCRLCLAVPEGSKLNADNLPDGTRIATSYPRLAKQHLGNVRVTTVSGAVEATPTLQVADAIVDLVSSGSTLAMNHLVEAKTLLESTCRLVTPLEVRRAVADELDRLVFALRSVLDARGKRYLMADVPRSTLQEIQSFLPGLAGPTVVELAGNPDTVAIQVVVDDRDIFDAVHRLKGLGAAGILVMPIERLVP